MSVVRILLGVMLVGGVAVGAAFTLGVGPVGDAEVQRPSFGIIDYGDWGDVSEDRTEIVTTLWVDNPNPVGVEIGDAITVQYSARFNGVRLADGQKEGISISNGNNTVDIHTALRNDQLPAWWVAYIQANETIDVRANSSVEVSGAGLQYARSLPEQRKTVFENETPIISAIDAGVSGLEGENVSRTAPGPRARTVGYEVTDASASWGEVNQSTTTLRIRFEVTNIGNVSEPAVPENFAASARLNGVELVDARGDAFSLRGSNDRLLEPGESQEIVYVTEIDNDRIDEWFTSHVRRDERTHVNATVQMQFDPEVLDGTISLPEEGTVRYECDLQTALLVDDQNTSTTCGSGGTLTVGSTSVDLDESTPTPTPKGDGETTPSTATATATTASTPTATPTPTNEPPTARIKATPTEGSAPLEVTFDASGSTDPDGDIREYGWRFDDGSGARGEQVQHTFRTAGTYEVELVVVDDDGNRDRTTVTITVSRR